MTRPKLVLLGDEQLGPCGGSPRVILQGRGGYSFAFRDLFEAWDSTLKVLPMRKTVFCCQFPPRRSRVGKLFFECSPSPDPEFFGPAPTFRDKALPQAVSFSNVLSAAIEDRFAFLEVPSIRFRQPILLEFGDAAIEFLSSRRAGREPVGFFRQSRTMLHNLSQQWMGCDVRQIEHDDNDDNNDNK